MGDNFPKVHRRFGVFNCIELKLKSVKQLIENLRASEVGKLLFLIGKVEFFVGHDGIPRILGELRKIFQRKVEGSLFGFEYVAFRPGIDKPFSELFDIFKEVLGIFLFEFSEAGNFNGKEFLRRLIVLGNFLWFLYFRPDALHVFVDFPSELAFFFLLVIEVPDAEEQRFGRLLLKLRNTNLHNCIQSLVLRSCVLTERFRPNVNDQGIGLNKGERRHHFFVFLLVGSFDSIVALDIHDDDVGFLIERSPNSERGSLAHGFLEAFKICSKQIVEKCTFAAVLNTNDSNNLVVFFYIV
jgi:hypothetical protein